MYEAWVYPCVTGGESEWKTGGEYEMNHLKLDENQLIDFENHLIDQERSALTIEKYVRDVKMFFFFMNAEEVTKAKVLAFKKHLSTKYKPTSINSMIAAINGFFDFLERPELKVKPLKIQRSMFSESEKELTREEYKRLLHAAKRKKSQRLYLLIQTIFSTGIRVSELRFITIEALRNGKAQVESKGKHRTVFLVPELRKLLLRYTKQEHITKGSVFVSKRGLPLSRHRIWADMKGLCEDADVERKKVFPHNLRHLFARTFYSIEKDLGRLADILGHSSINTTRIYTMECGHTHEQILQRLSLVI